MSNTGDLLTDLGSQNGLAVKLAGDAIGVLADFSGAASAVIGLIDLFLPSDNQVADALSQLQSTLQQDFSQVNATLRATQIIARQQALVASTAQAESTLQSLPAALRATSPVSEDYKLTQITNCLDALDYLDQDVQWMTVQNDELYFTGDWTVSSAFWNTWSVFTGSGTILGPSAAPALHSMPPPGNGDGTAFSDRYVLPLFMKELAIFLAVATAFDANYKVDYASALNSYSQRLIWAYNISVSGIVPIATPTQVDIGVGGFPWRGDYESYSNYRPYIYLTATQWLGGRDFSYLSTPPYATGNNTATEDIPDSGGGAQQGVGQPYGVVHTYTGAANIVAFPPVVAPQSGPPPPDKFYPIFLTRLMIATRARWKELHTTLGLTQVVDTANKLLSLTGEPPFLSPNPGTTWTLREIANLFAQADPSGGNLPPQPSGRISAKSVAFGLDMAAVSQTADEFYPYEPSLAFPLRNRLNRLLAATVCSGVYTDALPPGAVFGPVAGLGG